MKTEININGTIYIPKENQPVKPETFLSRYSFLLPLTVLVSSVLFLLYISGFLGGCINQDVYKADDGEVYLSTRTWYKGDIISTQLDEIKKVTPELKNYRLQQAEKLLETLKN